MPRQPRPNRRPRHGVILADGAFQVRHRNRNYGPFLIQWALDLSAMELVYHGQSVASVGVQPSVYADFDGTDMPDRVREVSTVVFAAIHESIRLGFDTSGRAAVVENTLLDHGLGRFHVFLGHENRPFFPEPNTI